MSTNRDIIDAFMYSDATNGAPRPEVTVTTTITNPGGDTLYWDMGALGRITGNSPERYEASLRVRGQNYGIVYTEIKPPWYAKLFARLLGLEWHEEMVFDQETFYGGQLAWTNCKAGEDLSAGDLVGIK